MLLPLEQEKPIAKCMLFPKLSSLLSCHFHFIAALLLIEGIRRFLRNQIYRLVNFPVHSWLRHLLFLQRELGRTRRSVLRPTLHASFWAGYLLRRVAKSSTPKYTYSQAVKSHSMEALLISPSARTAFLTGKIMFIEFSTSATCCQKHSARDILQEIASACASHITKKGRLADEQKCFEKLDS
jgi:hypothetical protein